MICKHPQNDTGNSCFIAINGWDKPCNDCPCPKKAMVYLETPEAQQIHARAKRLLERIDKEMVGKKVTT